MSNLTSIPLTTITGEQTSLADFSGKVLMIVNVASKCGLTPQYTALESLYQQFKDRGFTILAFPANDFAGQEPGTNEEIAQFCSTEYPVTFPLFAKIHVTGPEVHDLYAELTSDIPEHIVGGNLRDDLDGYATKNGLPGTAPFPSVLWNFEKFIVDKKGVPVARFAPDIKPDDPKVIAAIEQALGA